MDNDTREVSGVGMESATITVRAKDGSTLTIKPKGGMVGDPEPRCFIGIQKGQEMEVGVVLSYNSIYLIANALLSVARV